MQDPLEYGVKKCFIFLIEDSRTDLTHAGDNMERLSLHVLNSLQVLHFNLVTS